MNTQKVKQIIAGYLKIPAEQVSTETLIGRGAIANSIVLHRMYAEIAKEGVVVDYQDVQTFGDLLKRISGGDSANETVGNSPVIFNKSEAHEFGGTGIDIEEVLQMPAVQDFQEDEFYKLNFTREEIAYCSLQVEPLVSFCGLFAAKEAISKADEKYKNYPFNKMNIEHLPGGKPFADGFEISISHTRHLAVAVAIKKAEKYVTASPLIHESDKVAGNSSALLISLIALIMAMISLCLYFFHR